MRLFKFQKNCVRAIHRTFQAKKIVCLGWYTGSGKTNVFLQFVKEILERDPAAKIGISCYITTEIKDQVWERMAEFDLQKFGTQCGYGQKRDNTKNIFVFNPQAIHRKPLEVKLDYLIVDESHVGVDDLCVMIPGIMKKQCKRDAKIILASATPWDILLQKEFKDAVVFKRPLDQGKADGLIGDFNFQGEEANIAFNEKDFNRRGDLNTSAAMREMAILKSACQGKMEYLVKNYNKELGKKVLVICPPGNAAEVARHLGERNTNSLAYIQKFVSRASVEHWIDTDANLEKFKTDKNTRFLFVINKCGVGFDMKDLDSVVDLTMTRNVKSLAQRIGRVARDNGNTKHYFYVYDKSFTRERLYWLISTTVDFSLGSYEGWSTKTVKYRPAKAYAGVWSQKHPFSVTFKEVVKVTRDNIETVDLVRMVHATQTTKWTLEKAVAATADYVDRTDLWKRRPALYKWFRVNAKEEMDKIFPIKHRRDKWNEETVEACVKSFVKNGGETRRGRRGVASVSRKSFDAIHSGAYGWIQVNRRYDILDKHLPRLHANWSIERVRGELKKIDKWTDVRNIGGMRGWMMRHKGEQYWKNEWMKNIHKGGL